MSANMTTRVHMEAHVAESILLLISCIAAITANIIVMTLICKVRRLKKTTNLFVFSLCLCNIMFSLVVVPLRTFIILTVELMTLTYKYIVIIAVLVYICNLTAVARHRLLCITKPMTYIQKQTRRKVVERIILAWTLPLLYCLLPIIWFNQKGMSSTEKVIHNVYKLQTLVFLIIPFLFMVYVFLKVYQQAKQMRKYLPTTNSTKISLVNKSIDQEHSGKTGKGTHHLGGGQLKEIHCKSPCLLKGRIQ